MRPGRSAERGVATVWAVVLISVLSLLTFVVVGLIGVIGARHQAEAAADLAALAAAVSARDGGDPCAAAEAVARANASLFGLTAAVVAATTDQGMAVARQLQAGIVHVNDQPVNDEPQMPFGGVRDSGWGRFGVGYAVEDFTELQWMTTRSSPRQYPF